MAGLENLIGSEVISKGNEKVKTESFSGEGKVLGIYFSAHWCPPCRAFTPALAEWYKTVKESDNGINFEILFVSSDRDQAAFDEYFAEMPWKALPYEDRDRKGKLSKKFKVSGIPMLVFVDAGTGQLITGDGRSVVTSDPKGEQFPWTPKPLSEILSGNVLKNKDGEETTIEEATKDKVVGLYFSAHWCPPCKAFTPVLAATYKKLKEQGKAFEIIFVSSDRSEDSFKEYFGEMPWLSIPYKDDRVKELSSHFDIEGIPTFVLLDEERDIITKNGRGAVNSDKDGKDFPWAPQPLSQLTGDSVSAVNETASLIFLTEGNEANVKLAKECMEEMATRHFAEAKAARKKGEDQDELLFFYEEENDDNEETASSLRNFLNLEDRSPLVFLLDIPQGKKYVLPEDEVPTKARLEQLVQDYKEEKLALVSMR